MFNIIEGGNEIGKINTASEFVLLERVTKFDAIETPTEFHTKDSATEIDII